MRFWKKEDDEEQKEEDKQSVILEEEEVETITPRYAHSMTSVISPYIEPEDYYSRRVWVKQYEAAAPNEPPPFPPSA